MSTRFRPSARKPGMSLRTALLGVAVSAPVLVVALAGAAPAAPLSSIAMPEPHLAAGLPVVRVQSDPRVFQLEEQVRALTGRVEERVTG